MSVTRITARTRSPPLPVTVGSATESATHTDGTCFLACLPVACRLGIAYRLSGSLSRLRHRLNFAAISTRHLFEPSAEHAGAGLIIDAEATASFAERDDNGGLILVLTTTCRSCLDRQSSSANMIAEHRLLSRRLSAFCLTRMTPSSPASWGFPDLIASRSSTSA